MIKLITNKPKINNDIADIIRLFYSFEKIVYDSDASADIEFLHTHEEDGDKWVELLTFSEGVISRDFTYEYIPIDVSDNLKYMRNLKRSAMLAFFFALKDITGKSFPWGALTGIRPTQFYRALDEETGGNARQVLKDKYDVSDKKTELVEETIKAQDGIYQTEREDSVDLYIGIPFCPTRCEYCSFISFDMSLHKAPLEEYKKALIKEIAWFNGWREKNNKKLRSIYIGGGTPTSIPAEMLSDIMEAIDYKKGIEFTVEAGRPDTINDGMLDMLQRHGVTRISINPQSMNDKTLKRMKRPHTAGDIKKAFALAREYDFIINMDLILGLFGESIDDIKYTLDEVAKLDIDNLTIHTLAVKRASKLKENMESYVFTDEKAIREMVDAAHDAAHSMGMHPYYMYRQKYMSGNLENVGYSMPGKDCIYNVDVMEETHSLLALGAGAVSKRMFFEENRHVRFANHKSILHYIDNIDSQLLKKDDFFGYN